MNKIHCYMLRFKWYRKWHGIPESNPAIDDIKREALHICYEKISAMQFINSDLQLKQHGSP